MTNYSRAKRPPGVNPLWARFQPPAPADWRICPVGSLGIDSKGKLPGDLQETPFEGAKPYLLIEGLLTGIPQGYTAQKGLPECTETDTVLVADGSRSGLVLRGRCGVLGSTLLIYRAFPEVDDVFLYYLLESFYEFLNKAPTGGAIPHLDQDLLARLKVVVPPTQDEQTRIAETLKAADDNIRALEEQYRKAERVKTSLLQFLFVSGLPGAEFPTIDSKIGFVPSHWTFQRTGKTFREPPFSGVSPESRPNPPGTPILNVSCVNDGQCTIEKLTYVDLDKATIKANSALKGDFFVLRGNGNRDYVGTGGWLRVDPPENCVFSDKLIRLRFDTNRVAEGFYPYLWQSRAFQIRLQSKAQSGSGLWMMTKRDISREWVALPPKDEQIEMVEILDAATEALSTLQKQLTAARRVKQSLLQNLLTGKIRLKA